MKKTVMKISDIKPNPNNPRLIKDDKFKKLVQSLKDFPEMLDAREIVVNTDMVILGGNMRYKAARSAGLKELPVKIVDWSEEKQREFVIKDNVSGGEWDWDLLANEWDAEELDEWGLDIIKTVEVSEDEAPDIDKNSDPISNVGSIYRLGDHMVYCGSFEDEKFDMIFTDRKADMIFSDPPYGVSYSNKSGKVHNDDKTGDELATFLNKAFTIGESRSNKNHAALYFCADLNLNLNLLQSIGLKTTVIIWCKDRFTLGRSDYQYQTEPLIISIPEGDLDFDDGSSTDDAEYIIYAKTQKAYFGNRRQSNVWFFKKPVRNDDHPTMKPIALCSKAILNHTISGGLVYDGFLGSGSTLIACEQTGRICYGSELDPRYVDVIRKRYWKFVNDNNEDGWEENTPEVKE